MGLLHHVDTLYSGLGGYAGTGRRIDCGWTASLTGTWGARRWWRCKAFHRDMPPFRSCKLLTQIIQIFGITEVEIRLRQWSAPGQVTGTRFIVAGYWRSVVIMFSQRFSIKFHVAYVFSYSRNKQKHGVKRKKYISYDQFITQVRKTPILLELITYKSFYEILLIFKGTKKNICNCCVSLLYKRMT